MKILLVRPFFDLQQEEVPIFLYEPLGLEYLAAVCKNHTVEIYDCLAEKPNKFRNERCLIRVGADEGDLKKRIKKFRPDIVGISALFFSQVPNVTKITELVKEFDADILTVIGGSYPSSFKEKVFENDPHLDVAVIGEGEQTFVDLADNLKNLSAVKGIIYRDNGKIVANPPRDVILDLDSIPLPNRLSVKMRNYSRYAGPKENVRARIKDVLHQTPLINKLYYKMNDYLKKEMRFPVASIITSRGCPNRCTFCSVHNLWGQIYRMRSAKNVLTEIEILVKEYGVREINIVDDNFTVSKSRAVEICEGIVEKGLDIRLALPSGVFLPSVDREVLSSLKKAGTQEIYFAIENGNQEFLRNVIKKNINLKQAKEMIKMSKELGLRTNSYFILGYPGETKQTMIDTIRFAYESGLDRSRFHIYQPFPHTEIYDHALSRGYIQPCLDLGELRMKTHMPQVKTENFLPQDVLDLKNIASKIFKERNFSKYKAELDEIANRKVN